MLEHSHEPTKLARAIGQWSASGPLWQRRAACVAFVNHAKHGDERVHGLSEVIVESCENLVRDSERFAQTGVGWVMRELSLAELSVVTDFAERNLHLLSREAVRSLTKKMPEARRRELLERHTDSVL